MIHLAVYQYVIIVLVMILAGLFAGFAGAFFGVGGGTILVPVLLTVYSHIDPNIDIDMHQAIAASLALVVFNTFSAARHHYKAGRLPLDYFKGWGAALFVGTLVAAFIMAYISSYWLKIIFTAYLFIAFTYKLFKREPKQEVTDYRLPRGVVKYMSAGIIGMLSVLLGLAGGAFTTPYLSYFKYPIKRAMAISVAGGVIIGLMGTIISIINGLGIDGRIPISLGYVNIITVVVVGPFVALSAPWGVRLSSRLPNRVLHWLYVAFLLFIALYMVYKIS